MEQLEKLATLGDAERETIENLNTTISHLELEDTKKIEERQRNSKVDTSYITNYEIAMNIIDHT